MTVQIDGLIEYDRNTIEAMAIDFIRRRVDVSSTNPPVDVELLLENSTDVELSVASGIVTKYSVEGCVCNESGARTLTVWVDKNIADGPNDARYNAVIAEELAHIELHRALFYQVKSIEGFLAIQRHPKWEIMERDARLMSAAMRMPVKLVLPEADRVYRRIVDDHGFGEPQAIAKLIRNSLAETFVVHPDEMNGRLSDWPCSLYGRVVASVEERSPFLHVPPVLAEIEKSVSLLPPLQQKFFDAMWSGNWRSRFSNATLGVIVVLKKHRWGVTKGGC